VDETDDGHRKEDMLKCLFELRVVILAHGHKFGRLRPRQGKGALSGPIWVQNAGEEGLLRSRKPGGSSRWRDGDPETHVVRLTLDTRVDRVKNGKRERDNGGESRPQVEQIGGFLEIDLAHQENQRQLWWVEYGRNQGEGKKRKGKRP